MKEYIIKDLVYIDVLGAAEMLNKAVGTIRNRINARKFPSYIKVGTKLYFEKESIEKYKSEMEIVKIKSKED